MRRILVAGKNGQVGRELVRTLAPLGLVLAFDRSQLNLANPDSIRKVVRETSPDVIVNVGAYTAVDKAEAEPDLAIDVNARAPAVLAEEAQRSQALLVHYSTDYVFDGRQSRPYTEEDIPCPLNIYGMSKWQGEEAIRQSGCAHLILRTSWVYDGHGNNFVLTILRLAREREELKVVDDQLGSPTWARALALATARLISADVDAAAWGVYHLSAAGFTSRYHLAQKIIEVGRRHCSADNRKWASLRPVKTVDYPMPASRPLNSILSNEKIKRVFGVALAPWETQLASCLDDVFRLRKNP